MKLCGTWSRCLSWEHYFNRTWLAFLNVLYCGPNLLLPMQSTHQWCNHAQLWPKKVLQRLDHRLYLGSLDGCSHGIHQAWVSAHQDPNQYHVGVLQLCLKGVLVAQETLHLICCQKRRSVTDSSIHHQLLQKHLQALSPLQIWHCNVLGHASSSHCLASEPTAEQEVHLVQEYSKMMVIVEATKIHDMFSFAIGINALSKGFKVGGEVRWGVQICVLYLHNQNGFKMNTVPHSTWYFSMLFHEFQQPARTVCWLWLTVVL